ncbi:cysteine dioxygenase [Spirillospora sp. CA-294931]|uniref:cysteine dioxygenase n=1 Tax=Spirillospora sp. CA-294931 TaxID=3240042 RepID=UPI003D8F008C
MNLDMVPDLAMRGQDDPHGRPVAPRPPTVGQLASRVRRLVTRPGDWWHLVTFGDEPVRVPLDEGVWLMVWPPGHRSGVEGPEVSAVVAGELAEVTIDGDGVTERPLRGSRVQVRGGATARELVNLGPAYAVTLHASA